MEKKEEKKSFWASLFAPKACCCGPQIEEITDSRDKSENDDSDESRPCCG